MGFRYIGDGTEPEEYRQGAKMNAGVDIYRYDPAVSYQSDYLANVEDIENVRFVRRVNIPSKAENRTPDASYEFAYQGRRVTMVCQMWDASKTAVPGDKLRPVFPLFCSPEMPFRAGDLQISVNQRTTRFSKDRPEELIPPEEWPKQWAYTINKVLSYRIKSGEGASQ
jgi:hypothetical protein